MDILSIIGILLGFSAILVGNFLEGGQLAALINLPALVIVFGGTLGATLLHFSPKIILYSIKILWLIVHPRRNLLEQQINKVVKWSALARKEGLLGLEVALDNEKDPFAKKGLQLLVDGNEPEVIRDCLEVELNTIENTEIQAAKVYEAMGGYSPTIGIIGAIVGLIHVMQNLTDPELLGTGIATAFVATIYGVGFANLLFLPIANKLKFQAYALLQAKEMMLEGITAIAEGENPRNIELKLSGYIPSINK
ncbi:MAG: flagellar motor protein [Methylococcales bacterium]|nr:flagellar motor protein [Methylococcales bacterium]